ncbi:MAG: hypothetical protein L3K14_10130 [Thermoplasmata archaeon]|nr:hypothetical protein [Thermoplasmata archaeon]
MIVVLDRQAPLRNRPSFAMSTPGARNVVLGLAPAPARLMESAWPKWLVTFENTSRSVARASHRRSRRIE